jgi:type III pantothenate kinase
LRTYLLLDIGNTNIKAGISRNDKIEIIFNKSYVLKNILKYIPGILNHKKYSFDYIGVSTTNVKIKRILTNYFKKNKQKFLFIDSNTKIPIVLKYKSRLGADRISGSVGSVYSYLNHRKILYIDFGTATTVNVIIDKTFIGGLIAPGISTSFDSLIKHTTLPKVSFKIPGTLINDNTKENIQAGVYYMSYYFINNLIQNLKKGYKNLYVVSTGGSGTIISEKVDLIDIYDKYLVLKGINFILKYNDTI